MNTSPIRRTPYPSDVGDEEWALVAPYLTLTLEDARQRTSPLRELFNGLRWMIPSGASWQIMLRDLPSWHAVSEQIQRRIRAGCFDQVVQDLSVLIRLGEQRAPQPSAVIIDRRTLQSTPESGARAGWDRTKRPKRTKVHMVVVTLGEVLALKVTLATAQN